MRDPLALSLAAPGGTRLDGTYARADYRGAGAPRLVLRAEGSDQERNNFMRMIGSRWHLVQPDGEAMAGRVSGAQLARRRSVR